MTISGPSLSLGQRPLPRLYSTPSLVRNTLLRPVFPVLPPSPFFLRTSRASSHSRMAQRQSSESTKGHPSAGSAQGPQALSWLVRDGPEYEERKKRAQFEPPSILIKDVHAAVPRHLFERNTAKGLFYVARTVGLSVLFYKFATRIDQLSWATAAALGLGPAGRSLVSWSFWILFWFWQSVAFAGFWTLGAAYIHSLGVFLFELTCARG